MTLLTTSAAVTVRLIFLFEERKAVMLLFITLIMLVVGQVTESATNNNGGYHCQFSVVGAGPGGLYAAWRLGNSSVYPWNKICVFEKTNRVGGRAYSVRGYGPVVDIGAHRFQPVEHVIMNSLVTQILNLPTSCYSRTADCLLNQNQAYFIRNAYTGDFETSHKIPYFLNADELWTKKEGQPNPLVEVFEDNYLFFFDYLANFSSLDPSIHYPTMTKALNQIRTYQVNNIYPNQLDTHLGLPQHSSEYFSLFVDSNGESLSTLPEINLYDAAREEAYYGPDEEGAEKLVIVYPDTGLEAGYATVSETLATLLESKGVSVYLNSEVSGVHYNNNVVTLSLSNGGSVNSNAAVLNIPPTQLLQLSHDSAVFTPATKQLFSFFRPVCAVKGYLYYKTRWWDPYAGFEVTTTNNLKFFDLKDSSNDTTGGGYINAAYPDGADVCFFFQQARQNQSDPLVIIQANTTDAKQLVFYQNFLGQFEQSIQEAFNFTIPIKPVTLVMGVWDAAWHQNPTSNYTGGAPSALALNPVPGIPIYLANEAYSWDQGWAEGSLAMAEKVCHKYFNLNRLPWMGNSYWYNAIIEQEFI